MLDSAYRRPFVSACIDDNESACFHTRLEEIVKNIVATHATNCDEEAQYPSKSIDALASIGAFGIAVPKRYGGLGLSDGMTALAVETVARECRSTASILMFHSQVTRRLVRHGSDNMKERDLPTLASGKALAASAWTEVEAGTDKSKTRTALTRRSDNGGLILNGMKVLCTGIERAAIVHVLSGCDDVPGQQSFVRVSTSDPGVDIPRIEILSGLRGSGTGSLKLAEVALKDDAVVGIPGDGASLMMDNHSAPISPALLALASAADSFEAALLAARKTDSHGSNKLTFQDVRFKLAEIEIELEAMYCYASRAVLQAKCETVDAVDTCLKFKSYATDRAQEVVAKAVTLCGASAFIAGSRIDRAVRDSRATTMMGPVAPILKERIAAKYQTR